MKYLWLFSLLALVSTDLPIHCPRALLEGRWTFWLDTHSVTDTFGSNTCGHPVPGDARETEKCANRHLALLQ